MKKAMELSILCDSDIVLIVFNSDQLYQYSSSNIDPILKRYRDYDGPCESLTNNDVLCTLSSLFSFVLDLFCFVGLAYF